MRLRPGHSGVEYFPPVEGFRAKHEWAAVERRETRRTYRALVLTTIGLALMLPLVAASGETGLAVIAGLGVLVGASRLVSLRRRGIWGRELRFRRAAAVFALIGLALFAYAALWAIYGHAEPTIVFGVLGLLPLLFAKILFAHARFLTDAGAAVDPEPVRAICAGVRGMWNGEEPQAALVLTDERVAKVEASDSGLAEVDSIAVADITRVDPSLDRNGGSIVLCGKDAELAVHRAPVAEVHALYGALRRAGVTEC